MDSIKSAIHKGVLWFIDLIGNLLLVVLLISGVTVMIGLMEVLRDLFSYYGHVYQTAITVFGITLIIALVFATLGGFRNRKNG